MENKKEKNKSIGAWNKITKNSKTYISFNIEGNLYSMWKNEFKEKPNQPDYKIYKIDPLNNTTNE